MRRLLPLVLLCAVLSGCGGSTGNAAATTSRTSTSVSTSTTVTIEWLARQYEAIVAPVNAAGVKFRADLTAAGDNATGAQVAKIAAPYLAASATMDEALLRLPWPPNIKPDVNALVSADKALEATLGSADSQNAFSAPAWLAQLTADGGKGSAAVAILRADLGLKPAAKI